MFHKEFKWYASTDGDDYEIGPLDSYEEAFSACKDLLNRSGEEKLDFHICQAKIEPFDVSTLIDAESFADDIDSMSFLLVDETRDGGDILANANVSEEQWEDFEKGLQSYIKNFFDSRGIVFYGNVFTDTIDDCIVKISREQ